MSTQNYNNHKRYYIPHHFIFLPLVTASMVFAFYFLCSKETGRLTWLLFGISSFFILFLALLVRQHYALGNQNRIVRLEFRLRYFELFGQPAAAVEKLLTFSQIAALRFAGDTEFKSLLDKTLAENLSADEIKRSVKNWQADNMRL